MPFTLPTLGTLRRLVRDNVTAYLNRPNRDGTSSPAFGADASVPNSNLRVHSEAQAGLAFEVVLFVRWLANQFLPDTAEKEWLDRHADIWLRQNRKAATYATGTIELTGTEGAIVPLGTRFFGANALEFETTEQVIIGTRPVEVAVQAIEPGTSGNLAEGAQLSIAEAIPGVSGAATVVQLSGGVEIENDDLLRERVLERWRNPPHGGADFDYTAWAKEVAGVTRAWGIGNEMGVGTVTVRFMMDELRAEAEGIPTPDDVAAVAAHVDEVRPVSIKDLFVVAPIPEPINITIANLVREDAATKAAIEASLREMLYRRAAPGQTIYRSWVGEAISSATGEDHHDLTFANADMPSAGHIATLGTIIYA